MRTIVINLFIKCDKNIESASPVFFVLSSLCSFFSMVQPFWVEPNGVEPSGSLSSNLRCIVISAPSSFPRSPLRSVETEPGGQEFRISVRLNAVFELFPLNNRPCHLAARPFVEISFGFEPTGAYAPAKSLVPCQMTLFM